MVFLLPSLELALGICVWGYFWLKPQPSLSRKEARSQFLLWKPASEGATLLRPSPPPCAPSAPFSWERKDTVGEAFREHVSPLNEHRPVSRSPHVSTREYIASGLKIGRCSDCIRGREEKEQDGRWMGSPFVLLINASAENS